MSSDFEDWVSKVSSWKDATSHVPTLVQQEIRKSKYEADSPAHGPKSEMFDPLSIQFAMGYKDRKYSLSYDVCKRIPQQLAIIAAILQTRTNQVSSFASPFRLSKSLGFEIKHKNPARSTTKGERELILSLEQFIYSCGSPKPNPHSDVPRDDFETFLKKIVRDSLMYDQVCIEVVPDRKGLPYEFLAVDASTIRIANDSSFDDPITSNGNPYGASSPSGNSPYRTMNVRNPEIHDVPAFRQLINGQIRNTYTRKEMIFGVRNPRTDIYIQGYGYSELEQLITIITSHLYAEEYNRRFFMQNSAPKGILNFKGDNLTPETLESFRRQWKDNVEGVTNCLSGDTRVYTKEYGFVSLAHMCGSKNEVPTEIWTGTSWETGLVYKTDAKVLCHTNLDNGLTLSTSPDHKIRVVGDSGEPEWRIQSELTVGDVVLVNNQDTSAGAELMCLGKKATPEFMECLGWLLGDGTISKRAVRWYYHQEKEQEILEQHLSVIKEYFPKAVKTVHIRSEEEKEHILDSYGFKSVADRITSITLNDASAVHWLVAHGFMEEGKKSIPNQLYVMPLVHRTSYIRGMFSADGNNAKLRSPEITICSERTRTQMKHLLMSVGTSPTAVVSSVVNTGILVPMFDVSVNHKDHIFVGENVYCSNSWRTPILQAEQGIEWIPMQGSNQEMEYGQYIEYLLKVTCGVFLIDPAELNFDMHGGVQQTPLFESSQEWKLKASRDRGLKPMLRFIAKLINDNIVARIDDHFTFDFVGLDELTEQEKLEVNKEKLATYKTLNEIRRTEDLPDVEHGDIVLNPVYTTAVQQIKQMEMQEKQTAAAAGAAPTGGQPGAPSEEGGAGDEEDKESPQYADGFSKSLTKVLQISLEDETDHWIDLYRGS